MSATKRCTKCGQEKPPDGFYRDARFRTGLHPWCKECKNARARIARQRRAANGLQQNTTYCQRWRKTHPEEWRAYNRERMRRYRARKRAEQRVAR